MLAKTILAALFIGGSAATSFAQTDSQYPLSIFWPTTAGNHTIGSEPAGRPYKFVNILKPYVDLPTVDGSVYFSGANVASGDLIDYNLLDPVHGALSTGAVTEDSIAICIQGLFTADFVKYGYMGDRNQSWPRHDSNGDNFDDNVGNPINTANPGEPPKLECYTMWIREDSLGFPPSSFGDDLLGNFRHPFLHNAMTLIDDDNNPTTPRVEYVSPLKNWTQSFVSAIEARRVPDSLPDPNKWRF